MSETNKEKTTTIRVSEKVIETIDKLFPQLKTSSERMNHLLLERRELLNDHEENPKLKAEIDKLKSANNPEIDKLKAEINKLKSTSEPEVYSFLNNMAKDGKCAICNESTWLKRCIGQKNEDGSKTYFHEKCWEDLKYEENPELYKLGRKLRGLKTEIAQGQRILKEIDKQTNDKLILEDLKAYLMKLGKENTTTEKTTLYQLLPMVTDLVDLQAGKLTKPMKTQPPIEDKGYIFIPKTESPLPIGKPFQLVYCPIRKLNRSVEKCDECKEQDPQKWKSCEEDKNLNPDTYKPHGDADEKAPIRTNRRIENPETFREPFNGKR
jgi:hypothetical protein